MSLRSDSSHQAAVKTESASASDSTEVSLCSSVSMYWRSESEIEQKPSSSSRGCELPESIFLGVCLLKFLMFLDFYRILGESWEKIYVYS